VGRVEAVGKEISGFEPGERVICSGNHGSHWLVTPGDATEVSAIPQQYMIQKLPEGVSDTEACFAILGDVALHGIRRAKIQIGESVAVHGLGVIGLISLQLARWSGAYPTIGVDLVKERLTLATELGASHVIDVSEQDPVEAIHALTALPYRWRGALASLEPGTGAEVQIQSSANIDIYDTMMKAAADRGRLVMVGAPSGTVEIRAHELLRRELMICGSYQTGMIDTHPYWPWTRERNRATILSMIARGQLDVKPLISHVVPYCDAPEMYDRMAEGFEGWMSVFFTWEDT
jgi:threonine dehydrogenase-like Zn-dependent dehydrogenase